MRARIWFGPTGRDRFDLAEGRGRLALDEQGYMQRRFASINDLPIKEAERRFRWPLGRRPDEHPGLSDLGL